MSVRCEANDARKLMRVLRTVECDIVVLDIKMPGKSGLETLSDLRKLYPRLPVLILSTHSEDQYAARVLRAGAMGFLSKQAAPRDLISAIKKIHAGRKYASARVLEGLLNGTEAEKPLYQSLSKRELEVMLRIAEGKPLKEIAFGP